MVVTDDSEGIHSFVHLVNEKTMKVTGSVELGFFPAEVGVDLVIGHVYVPIQDRGQVSQFQI